MPWADYVALQLCVSSEAFACLFPVILQAPQSLCHSMDKHIHNTSCLLSPTLHLVDIQSQKPSIGPLSRLLGCFEGGMPNIKWLGLSIEHWQARTAQHQATIGLKVSPSLTHCPYNTGHDCSWQGTASCCLRWQCAMPLEIFLKCCQCWLPRKSQFMQKQ